MPTEGAAYSRTLSGRAATKQCTSDAAGSSNSKSAPPPTRPTVIHNFFIRYVRPLERPSITEIVIVTLSSNGTSGNLAEPCPLISRPRIPLTHGDRANRGSRCLRSGSLGNSIPSSEPNLKIVDDPFGVSRSSSKDSFPFCPKLDRISSLPLLTAPNSPIDESRWPSRGHARGCHRSCAIAPR